MKVIRHGRYTESEMRRVYTCKQCGCVYMPDAEEETKTPDKKDWAAECPDCGKLGRNYRVEQRVVLEVEGEALKAFFAKRV